MYRICIFLCSLFAFTHSPVAATSSEQDFKSDLRILELLPNLTCPLAVDPALPADFVALSPTGILDPYAWIYWGPKDVLNAHFEDQTSIKKPFIRVKLSGNVAQKIPGSLPKDHEEALKKMMQNDPQSYYRESKWGDYPVDAIKIKMAGQTIRTAWVGLNDPESGWVLMFNLVTPDNNETAAENLWNDFITKTTQLKDADYFKACGQDLQEGYTLLNVGGAKLKMIAEKRESDGTIQVVVIPESPNVEFHYVNMDECRMGAEWKHGEPMVKVYGEITVGTHNWKSVVNHVSSIFYKTVPDFTYKKNENPLTFQKTIK
jgi:hypothetical protein